MPAPAGPHHPYIYIYAVAGDVGASVHHVSHCTALGTLSCSCICGTHLPLYAVGGYIQCIYCFLSWYIVPFLVRSLYYLSWYILGLQMWHTVFAPPTCTPPCLHLHCMRCVGLIFMHGHANLHMVMASSSAATPHWPCIIRPAQATACVLWCYPDDFSRG